MLAVVREDLRHFGAVALMGPRTTGKSTLARQLAGELGGSYLDLDDMERAALAVQDPTGFVGGLPEPVVIDEFQHAPGVLAAIKAELNADYRPGRFLLTGSAHIRAVPALSKYLAGRVSIRTLLPFAEAELRGAPRNVVDGLFRDGVNEIRRDHTNTRREEITDLVVRGGFPLAVAIEPSRRPQWFRSLGTTIVERIDDDVRALRRPDHVAQLLRLAAAGTARLLNVAELGREIGLGRDQTGEYFDLLEAVHACYRLPAWSTNLMSRVTKSPKLHMVDTGWAATLLGLPASRFHPSDPLGSKLFGQLLETFVVNEMRKQAGWAVEAVTMYHARVADTFEVDLVMESADGRVVGIEVKASATVDRRTGRHLRTMRDRLGDRFVGGLVLHTGSVAQRIDDRIAVAPIELMWTA